MLLIFQYLLDSFLSLSMKHAQLVAGFGVQRLSVNHPLKSCPTFAHYPLETNRYAGQQGSLSGMQSWGAEKFGNDSPGVVNLFVGLSHPYPPHLATVDPHYRSRTRS